MLDAFTFALTLAAAVPATTWTEFQFDAANNAVFDSPSWNVAWRADIGKKSNGGISIVGDTIYIDSFDRNVYAFDALTGSKRWSTMLPNVLMNTPVVVSNLVIVGTGTAEILMDSPTMWVAGRPTGDGVYALDAHTGKIVWSFPTVGEDMPSGVAVKVKGRWEFVFANGDDHVYGLDAQTGHLLWKVPALGVDGMASLTAVNGIVYGTTTLGDAGYLSNVGSHPDVAQYWSRTWAVDPARDGQYVWQAPAGVADASVTADDRYVYAQGFELASKSEKNLSWAATMNGDARFRTVIQEIDRNTGALLWKYVSSDSGPNNTLGSAAFTSDMVLQGGVLYAPLAFASEFAALDAATGKPLWLLHTDYPVKTSPALKDGLLFFGDSGANLYVVSASNGTKVHEYNFPGPPGKWGFAKSAPVVVGNTLYISADRWLYALRVSELEHGVVSSQAAPPSLGPSGDWCVFDPQCSNKDASGVTVLE